jgi:hypothetical protein
MMEPAQRHAADRATARQKKTGRPVKFELTQATRQAVYEYLKAADKRPGDYRFTGRRLQLRPNDTAVCTAAR